MTTASFVSPREIAHYSISLYKAEYAMNNIAKSSKP